MFATFAILGAPTVPYVAATAAVVAATPSVVEKSPLSKHSLAVRGLKLKNKGTGMGALIEIYQEMEGSGQITSPAPIAESVVAAVIVPVVAPVVPDLGSDEEISSESEKDSSSGSPTSASSVSDAEEFLSKIDVTLLPTLTKAKVPRSQMQTPMKATPMKAVETEILTTPSPMRLATKEKSRPDSPTTPHSMTKLTGHGKKTFMPTLAAIECSPSPSPSKGSYPPASSFVRPGNPTPTKSARGARTFAPTLSPIASGDFEEEEEPSSPSPMLLGGILPTTTSFVEETESALDSLVPTIQVNGMEVVEAQEEVPETPAPTVEELRQAVRELTEAFEATKAGSATEATPQALPTEEECLISNLGAMATIAGAYLVAQSTPVALKTTAVVVGVAALAAYRFFTKKY